MAPTMQGLMLGMLPACQQGFAAMHTCCTAALCVPALHPYFPRLSGLSALPCETQHHAVFLAGMWPPVCRYTAAEAPIASRQAVLGFPRLS